MTDPNAAKSDLTADDSLVSPELARIDQIDEQILALLAERGDLTHAIASQAGPAGDHAFEPAKNQQKLMQLQALWEKHTQSKFPRQGLSYVFREILGACASIDKPVRIAYLGPPGTFSHLAAIQALGSAPQHIECSTIANVFLAVEKGEADFRRGSHREFNRRRRHAYPRLPPEDFSAHLRRIRIRRAALPVGEPH